MVDVSIEPPLPTDHKELREHKRWLETTWLASVTDGLPPPMSGPKWLLELEAQAERLKATNRRLGISRTPRPTLTLIQGGKTTV